jgi:hypothetical protein
MQNFSVSSLQPTPVYDAFWHFAAERQAIFERRKENPLGPWTEDPILRQHKFTNVYRASDRTSQYLIKNVIYGNEISPATDDAVFRILLFKLFNRIDTWTLLERTFGQICIRDFSPERFGMCLDGAMESGMSIYSGAYIMPSGSKTYRSTRKHRTHLAILRDMLLDDLPKRAADAKNLKELFLLLRGFPLIGDFLAYQYAIDINYSEVTDFSESEFVVPGPGSRSGIRKCFTELRGLSESEIISIVTNVQDREFSKRGLKFAYIGNRPLQQIDIQNIFCEVDKYARVQFPEITGRHNRSKIKQRFHPNSAPINYWYPPKWKINSY